MSSLDNYILYIETYFFIAIVQLLLTPLWIGICASQAQKKGRSAAGYAILGLFLGLMGVIIALCVSDLSKPEVKIYKNEEKDKWRCANCGAMNYSGLFCRVCGTLKNSKKKYFKEVKIDRSVWICPNCGEKNREESLTCCSCGGTKPM